MQTITVEWMHLDQDGKTCERCGTTGDELRTIISRLDTECSTLGTALELVETKLTEIDIAKSNTILINGVPLEALLPDAKVSTSCCESCGEITGREEMCRTIVQFGTVYETIPQQMIREAVCRVAQCC